MYLPEYDQWDAHAVAHAIASKQISPLDALRATRERIEARNPGLNAVVYQSFEYSASELNALPEGPFRGVPMLLKNLVASWTGHPMTSGSRLTRNHICSHDSHLVTRFKQAGCILVGRTNSPELGLLGVTEPVLHGPTRNPWNPERTCGGSSGGAGTALAARMVPLCHGGDGGGSLRIPAAATGVIGLKPTRGRISLAPWRGEAWGGMVQEFVLTRSVRDCAAMLDWLSVPAPGDPYLAPRPELPFLQGSRQPVKPLRIAFTAGPLLGKGTVHPDCIKGLEETAALLSSLGHRVEEAAPQYDREALFHAYMVMVATHMAADIHELEQELGRKASWEDLEPPTWFMRRLGESLSATDQATARNHMHAESRKIAQLFEHYDVLLTPTLARPPVRIGEIKLKPVEVAGIRFLSSVPMGSLSRAALGSSLQSMADDSLAATPNTQLFNQTGQPALSLPLCWNDEGLPIGMQLVGRFGDETTLLRLATQLEAARPWANRLPPCVGPVMPGAGSSATPPSA